MATLPPLSAILASTASPGDALAQTLSVLFEPSPVLFSKIVPQLVPLLSLHSHSSITTYHEVVHAALAAITDWDDDLKSQFIGGHPRIGESKNLSNLSANEQGAAVSPTPPEVLVRLTHLNACYERRYPGLRYITFVNGRSRATIAEEMEDCLGIEHSLSTEPPVEGLEPVEMGSVEWTTELNRAIMDVGRIAESRLGALGW